MRATVIPITTISQNSPAITVRHTAVSLSERERVE